MLSEGLALLHCIGETKPSVSMPVWYPIHEKTHIHSVHSNVLEAS